MCSSYLLLHCIKLTLVVFAGVCWTKASLVAALCCPDAADIQFEEKKVHKAIKDAAKRNDMATCKVGNSSRSSQGAAAAAFASVWCTVQGASQSLTLRHGQSDIHALC